MNPAVWIIAILFALAFAAALRHIFRRRGACECPANGCGHDCKHCRR